MNREEIGKGPIIIHKHKFIWFRNAKVAGTSLKKFCADLLGIEIKGDNDEEIHLQDYPTTTLDEIKTKYKDYFKFRFVRNPWDRLVSCYHNKIKSDKNFNDIAFKNGIQRSFLRYGDTFQAGMNFEDFVHAICNIPDSEADDHFVSQSFSKGNLLINFFGKFENLDKDFKYICKKIGLKNIKLSHLMKSDHENYKKYYTDETREMVRQRYKKDIETFGYDF